MMMRVGDRVEIVGDTFGNNSAFDVPEHLNQQGVLVASNTPGFWWVQTDNAKILASESELKELK